MDKCFSKVTRPQAEMTRLGRSDDRKLFALKHILRENLVMEGTFDVVMKLGAPLLGMPKYIIILN